LGPLVFNKGTPVKLLIQKRLCKFVGHSGRRLLNDIGAGYVAVPLIFGWLYVLWLGRGEKIKLCL